MNENMACPILVAFSVFILVIKIADKIISARNHPPDCNPDDGLPQDFKDTWPR